MGRSALQAVRPCVIQQTCGYGSTSSPRTHCTCHMIHHLFQGSTTVFLVLCCHEAVGFSNRLLYATQCLFLICVAMIIFACIDMASSMVDFCHLKTKHKDCLKYLVVISMNNCLCVEVTNRILVSTSSLLVPHSFYV